MAEEQEQEQQMISHFSHQHPLMTPIPESGMWLRSLCCGCNRYFRPGEAAYGCSDNQCGYIYCFHKECLEMPREIRHPLHPSHPLKQLNSFYGKEVGENWICAVCKYPRCWMWCYICSEGCELFIHLPCAVVGVGNLDEEVMMQHPSHPLHKLRYLRRPCSFRCDACGTTEKGSSYGCSICQYWIHESCASLLLVTASYPRHHHHPLSLAFSLPLEYIRDDYTCDVCKGVLRFKHWVYHCQLCRYVAHIKCATNTTPATINNEEEVDGSKDIIKFPINEVDEELIKPFVAREIGERGIGIHREDNKIINGKYQFHNHPHPIKLIMSSPSSSSSPHYNEEEDDDDDDNDGEDNHSGKLQCDGCTMPIHEHKQRSSPNNYLSCGEYKFFLHLVCFDLPLELPCLPVHSYTGHKLTLRNSDKLTNWSKCSICGRSTNGLYYSCTKCYFKVDIKCASLPHTIKHAAHPQRHHYLKLRMGSDVWSVCAGCYRLISGDEVVSYRCDSCRFAVCGDCVLLPATNKHRSEKHLLPLTYDANLNHPSEFYCGECEERMNPKSWMYHCPDCDQSFHPRCFPTTSGRYGNINFGSEEYMITPCHPHHPLRFQLITKKKYCDLCHSEAYYQLGFQCASCNFAMCFDNCGKYYRKTLKAIDY